MRRGRVMRGKGIGREEGERQGWGGVRIWGSEAVRGRGRRRGKIGSGGRREAGSHQADRHEEVGDRGDAYGRDTVLVAAEVSQVTVVVEGEVADGVLVPFVGGIDDRVGVVSEGNGADSILLAVQDLLAKSGLSVVEVD